MIVKGKIILLAFIMIIIVACERESELYVGLEIKEYVDWRDKTYDYPNDNLFHVKSDSLEIRR